MSFITMFLQVVSTHGFCGPDEYPITGYPGGKCLPCAKCQEGRGLVPKCGTHIVYQVDTIDCKPCESGEFSDKYDSSSCYVVMIVLKMKKLLCHVTAHQILSAVELVRKDFISAKRMALTAVRNVPTAALMTKMRR